MQIHYHEVFCDELIFIEHLFCKALQEKYVGKKILVHDPKVISGIETPRTSTESNLSLPRLNGEKK